MLQSKTLIRYSDTDHEIVDVETLSERALISRAFIRHCIAHGCPAATGLLSPAMLLEWLFENYASVRAGAGMRPLAPIDGVTAEALQRLKMGNAIVTLLEFAQSRTVEEKTKVQFQRIRAEVERALDRA